MALSFDDRILGEKVNNYCSSSEGESDGDSGDESCQREAPPAAAPTIEEPSFRDYDGHAANTGPKGVINDYEAFQKMERRKAREVEKLKVELAKKCTLACRTVRDDDDAAKLDQVLKEELEAHGDEFENEVEREFLEEYRRKRIEQMRRALANLPRYGKVLELTRATFVKEIDESVHHRTTVLVVIYADARSCDSENAVACARIIEALDVIAQEYSTAKVCRIESREASVSKRFMRHGVPALLVYKHGELIGNFIAVHRELAQRRAAARSAASSVVRESATTSAINVSVSDLEAFLLEFGYLPERTDALPPPVAATNTSTSGSQKTGCADDASDSDEETKPSAPKSRQMKIFQYSKRAADSDSDESD